MLPDLIAPGLDILFCGTAASRASAARGHYYAGPGNRFWPMLAETGLTPRLLRPEDDHLLPGLGLGLTDLAKGASGADRDIPASAYDPARLAGLIIAIRPRAVAFTSLAAARIALAARLLPGPVHVPQPWPGVLLWVLPSPSGLARGSFQPGPWHALAGWSRARHSQGVLP